MSEMILAKLLKFSKHAVSNSLVELLRSKFLEIYFSFI